MAMAQKVDKSRYGEPNLRINDEEQSEPCLMAVMNLSVSDLTSA
jgi:hypothetical protein